MKREERYVAKIFCSANKLLHVIRLASFLQLVLARLVSSGKASLTFGHANACKVICVYRQYNESVSEEMNNDNDLNLHLNDQMSGPLRYGLFLCFRKYQYLVFSVF